MLKSDFNKAVIKAGLAGEFARAAEEIKAAGCQDGGAVIALCLVAQEIRNLAMHIAEK